MFLSEQNICEITFLNTKGKELSVPILFPSKYHSSYTTEITISRPHPLISTAITCSTISSREQSFLLQRQLSRNSNTESYSKMDSASSQLIGLSREVKKRTFLSEMSLLTNIKIIKYSIMLMFPDIVVRRLCNSKRLFAFYCKPSF